MKAAAFSVARVAWSDLSNQFRWWSWLLIALVGLGLPGLLFAFAKPSVAWSVLAMMAACALLGLWTQLAGSVQHQNHPTLARLLPGHLLRLRLSLVLPFLLISLGAEALVPLPGAGVAMALSLCFLAATARWPLLWIATALTGLLPLAWARMSAPLRDLTRDLLLALNGNTALMLALAAGCLLLVKLVRSGGTAHEAGYAKRQCMRKAMRSGNIDHLGSQMGWFHRLSMHFYSRSMGAALARRDSSFARLGLALGPRAHWSSTGLGIGVLAVIVLLVNIGLWQGGVFALEPHALRTVGNTLFGFLSVLPAMVIQVYTTLLQRQHEQCLVTLLPGVPRGAAFNRALGRWLMREYLQLWGGAVLLMVLLMGWIPGTWPTLLTFSVATLPVGLLLWRDWSNTRRFGVLRGFATYLPLTAVAVGARHFVENGQLSVPVFLLAAALLMPPLAWWRWRLLNRAPMAWPAGRR